MYSHSVKWKADSLVEREERLSLNQARRKFCPDSFAWTQDINLTAHKEEMARLYRRRLLQSLAAPPHLPQPRPVMTSTIVQPPNFRTNHSAVLAHRTVFVPSFTQDKPIVASWPEKSEMKYEGDDRIFTDRLHGRCLAAPRIPGNDTVTWQHRAIVTQYPLDDFNTQSHPVAIFMRTHFIPELEISDEEGARLLGSELMDLLDPVDTL